MRRAWCFNVGLPSCIESTEISPSYLFGKGRKHNGTLCQHNHGTQFPQITLVFYLKCLPSDKQQQMENGVLDIFVFKKRKEKHGPGSFLLWLGFI